MAEKVLPYKKLWRSRTERKIAGVCGGLADFFSVDPVWIRLIFLFFFSAGGAALIAYIILWIIVPLEPEEPKKKKIKDE